MSIFCFVIYELAVWRPKAVSLEATIETNLTKIVRADFDRKDTLLIFFL